MTSSMGKSRDFEKKAWFSPMTSSLEKSRDFEKSDNESESE